jgi:hypothetical protein
MSVLMVGTFVGLDYGVWRLGGRFHFINYICLDDISGFDIIKVFNGEAALEAIFCFLDIFFKPL